MERKKLKVELKPWAWDDDEGSSDYGTDVFIDGVEITSAGDQEHILIRAILDHLGYDCEIIGYDYEGEESWQA
jgi:hypothetical protein